MVPRCGKVVSSGEICEAGMVVELKRRHWVIAIWAIEEGWKDELEWWC